MRVAVGTPVSKLKPGDAVVACDHGVFHTRLVHEVAGGTVTFLHGERLTLTPKTELMVVREIAGDEVELDVEDLRDRSDLLKVASSPDREDEAG